MEKNVKKFEVADVLSLATCTIFESRGTEGLEEVLEYMTGFTVEEYMALSPDAKRNLLQACIKALEEAFGLQGVHSPPCFIGDDMRWVSEVTRAYNLPDLLEVPVLQ